MPDPRTDEIAREAARIMESGRAAQLGDAIRSAAESLGYRNVPLPGAGRVRKHAQAMSMQSLGEAEYNRRRRQVWRLAEELMSMLEHAMPDTATLLVGRAASGHVDADPNIHVRLYTSAAIEQLAKALAEFGYDELTFQTVETRRGRMSQIGLNEEGIDVTLTRCAPHMRAHGNEDLFTGRTIETMTLPQLRQRLDE